jgi:hypothetical protein
LQRSADQRGLVGRSPAWPSSGPFNPLSDITAGMPRAVGQLNVS